MVGDAAGGRRHTVAVLRDAGAALLACVVGDMRSPARLAVAAGTRGRRSLAVVRDGTCRGRGSRDPLPGRRVAGDSRARPGVDTDPHAARDGGARAGPGRRRAVGRAPTAGGELSPVRQSVHNGVFRRGVPLLAVAVAALHADVGRCRAGAVGADRRAGDRGPRHRRMARLAARAHRAGRRGLAGLHGQQLVLRGAGAHVRQPDAGELHRVLRRGTGGASHARLDTRNCV